MAKEWILFGEATTWSFRFPAQQRKLMRRFVGDYAGISCLAWMPKLQRQQKVESDGSVLS